MSVSSSFYPPRSVCGFFQPRAQLPSAHEPALCPRRRICALAARLRRVPLADDAFSSPLHAQEPFFYYPFHFVSFHTYAFYGFMNNEACRPFPSTSALPAARFAALGLVWR